MHIILSTSSSYNYRNALRKSNLDSRTKLRDLWLCDEGKWKKKRWNTYKFSVSGRTNDSRTLGWIISGSKFVWAVRGTVWVFTVRHKWKWCVCVCVFQMCVMVSSELWGRNKYQQRHRTHKFGHISAIEPAWLNCWNNGCVREHRPTAPLCSVDSTNGAPSAGRAKWNNKSASITILS